MMSDAQDSTTPTNLIVSNLSNSTKKKYIPTPKLSERKRALFPINEVKIQNSITEEETDVQTILNTSSDSSLDGLEFYENGDPDKLIDKTNLLKNSSFLSRIEDINNDDFLLSADSSNDFEIPVQSPTSILDSGGGVTESPILSLRLEPESNDSNIVQKNCLKLDFHNAFKLLKSNDYASPKSTLSKFRKNNSNDSIDSNIIIPETPPKKDTPKTPYETLNTDLELPRMNNRKSLLSVFRNFTTAVTPDTENINEKYITNSNDAVSNNSNQIVQKSCTLNNLKRKVESPTELFSLSCPKLLKLNDNKKSSKVRTSLFTKENDVDANNKDELSVDNGLSPKLFYHQQSTSSTFKQHKATSPSLNNSLSDNVTINKNLKQTQKSKSTPNVYLCGRKSKKRNSFGEINAGVRTGIKKRKTKSKLNNSLTKNQLIKEEAFKFLKENSLKNSIWGKKIDKPPSPPSQLPSDQVNEMDNLIKQLKNPESSATINNLKRSSAVLQDKTNLDNENVNMKCKIPKIDNTPTADSLFQTTFPMSTTTKENKPKKFFKNKPTFDKMKINIFKNVNLKVENGKVQLHTTNNAATKLKNTRQKTVNFDANDLNVDEIVTVQEKVDNIIKNLNEKPTESHADGDDAMNIDNRNVVDLSAHYSQITDDNSIILHQPPPSHEIEMQDISKSKSTVPKNISPEDIIMSPTSLMCDMTSGLALTSPKKIITKAANLTNKLSNCPSKNELAATMTAQQQQQQKLYPIFVKGQTASAQMLAMTIDRTQQQQRMTTRSRKIWKNLLDDKQYQIDAGQKKWGVTQCPQCEVIYSQNEPEDEQKHLEFHNNVQYLKFNGWRNEKVVAQFNYNQERIIEIAPNDSKAWWKKVVDLLHVVDKDLGYGEKGLIDANITKVYFYIRNKQIIGFLSAVPVSTAYRMIPDENVDCCTNTSYPVKCGISRLWIASSYRRKHIATQLVDTLRKVFLKGSILHLNDLAFSVPSESGKQFACAYTKTNQYLVYFDKD